MKTNDEQIVHSFRRNQREKIIIRLSSYKGKRYADFRVWFQPKESQELRPSHKGLSISLDYLDELNQGMQSLIKARSALLKTDEKPV